jgi:hypothetical protein
VNYKYTYQQFGDDNFRVTAFLETNSDQSAADSQRACGIGEPQILDNVYMVCAQ